MNFFVLKNNEDKISDYFMSEYMEEYERDKNWSLVNKIEIYKPKDMTRDEIVKMTQDILDNLNKNNSNMLIGASIVGLPYQILNKNNIIMCEADEISVQLFQEIYEDFYQEKNAEINKEIKDIPPYPVCVSENGFYFFDFNKTSKLYPELSSKKMLIPFISKKDFNCLIIQTTHIMPWIESFVIEMNLNLDQKKEDGIYTINITRKLDI